MTVDQIAELAKKELDAAEAAVENAKRLLQEGALVGLGLGGGDVRGRGTGREQCIFHLLCHLFLCFQKSLVVVVVVWLTIRFVCPIVGGRARYEKS